MRDKMPGMGDTVLGAPMVAGYIVIGSVLLLVAFRLGFRGHMS